MIDQSNPDASNPDDRENYVMLAVVGEQVEPGDEYALLDDAVCQDGFVPLGLDTTRDGRCQIAPSNGGAKNLSRCDLVKEPAGEGPLVRRYALSIPRE